MLSLATILGSSGSFYSSGLFLMHLSIDSECLWNEQLSLSIVSAPNFFDTPSRSRHPPGSLVMATAIDQECFLPTNAIYSEIISPYIFIITCQN